MKKKKYSIGIDIGGTKMLAVLFDGKNIISEYTLATPKDNLDHFLIMIGALVTPLIEKAEQEKAEVIGVGVGVAAVMDYEQGISLIAPNIPILNGQKIGSLIENKIGVNVLIDNDTNCFVRAESLVGVAKKYNNVYGIIIGTGIGGGWWKQGDIYLGSQGGAGEPGAMIMSHEDPITLENAYKKLTQNNTAQLADEAYRGDPLAQKSFDEFAKILGIALANLVNIVDPEVIVLGGGAVNAEDLFMAHTKKTMQLYIVSPESKKIKILKSKLGAQAGAIGAALLIDLK